MAHPDLPIWWTSPCRSASRGGTLGPSRASPSRCTARPPRNTRLRGGPSFLWPLRLSQQQHKPLIGGTSQRPRQRYHGGVPVCGLRGSSRGRIRRDDQRFRVVLGPRGRHEPIPTDRTRGAGGDRIRGDLLGEPARYAVRHVPYDPTEPAGPEEVGRPTVATARYPQGPATVRGRTSIVGA